MPTVLALDRVLARAATDVFGRYELLGRLGTGGMAEVFVARCGDVPGMKSLVALKRILPHLADDEDFVSLFRREAQISLRLRHRAIARVFEVGCVGSAWFLAMELVPGEALAHVLRAEREQSVAVAPEVVAWVGAEMALALHHAHALTDGTSSFAVFHRDVSPENVLLGFDGAAKLIDFGVARCSRLSNATRAGTVRGKLAYASPEQLAGRPLDGRSNLFSLAAVIHEWVAGTPLFERESDAATVQAVQTAAVPALPRAPRLGRVLERALAREPERRFPDGEAFAGALLDAAGGPPPAPERLVAGHLARLFPDRQRRWQAITAGLDAAGPVPATRASTAGSTAPGTPAGGTPPARVGTASRRTAVRWKAFAVVAVAVGIVASALLAVAGRDNPRVSRAALPPPLARPPIVEKPQPAAEPLVDSAAATAATALLPTGRRAPSEPSPPVRRRARPSVVPAAAGTAHRAIVDELEPSPYKKVR